MLKTKVENQPSEWYGCVNVSYRKGALRVYVGWLSTAFKTTSYITVT